MAALGGEAVSCERDTPARHAYGHALRPACHGGVWRQFIRLADNRLLVREVPACDGALGEETVPGHYKGWVRLGRLGLPLEPLLS